MTIARFVCASLAVAIAGCNPITKSGIEAREQAYSRMDRTNAGIAYKQASDALQTGQLDKARTLVTQGLERYAQDADSWALLGRILMEQTRLDQAVLALNKAVELDPDNATSHYFLGVIFERWSKDTQAAAHYQGAFTAAPEKPQYLMAAAEALIASGDVLAAQTLVNSNLARFEHHAAMQHLLAHIAMLQNDPETASLRCEEARLLAPEDESIARDLCRMRFRNGQWARCIDAIEDWQARFGGDDPAMSHVLARCLVLVSRHNQARSSYRVLCDRDPENDMLWRERGLLAWSQQDWQTLENCTGQLETLQPLMYESMLFRAVCVREQGKPGRAKTLLEGLVEAHPDRSEAWALLASLRATAGDVQGAAKARQIAVKCDPAMADQPRVTGVFGAKGP